jgi:hypothetical protein
LARTKIPEEIQAEVIFKSDRMCCVCANGKRADHIHHIDSDNSNNKFENLAFLCFDCHDDATKKSSLKKKLNPKTILKFRDYHYRLVEQKRKVTLNVFNSKVNNITTEKLLEISKNAIIIIELEKIKEEFYKLNWNKKSEKLIELEKYSEHTNYRVAYALFNFLELVAYQAGNGMNRDGAQSIFNLVISFFPQRENNRGSKEIIELSKQCINIATDLAIEAFVFLIDFEIVEFALNILKFINSKGKTLKIPILNDEVVNAYKTINDILEKKNVDNLQMCKNLVNIYLEDLNNFSLGLPPLTDELKTFIKINSENRKRSPNS